MSENISAFSRAGRSLFLLTSLFIGLTEPRRPRYRGRDGPIVSEIAIFRQLTVFSRGRYFGKTMKPAMPKKKARREKQ